MRTSRPVLDVHIANGALLLALSLVAGVWGGVAWIRRRPAVGFWYVLRAMQVSAVLQAAFGSILLLSGRNADGLHYLYGVLPLLVSLLAEGLRVGIADRELEGLDFDSLPDERRRSIALAITRRETGAMAVSALVILFLALRAVGTSGY